MSKPHEGIDNTLWWSRGHTIPQAKVLMALDLEDGRIFVQVDVKGDRCFMCYSNGVSTGILYTIEEIAHAKQLLPN